TPVLLVRGTLDVFPHVPDLFGLLIQIVVHEVAHGNQLHHVAAPQDRQVTAAVGVHDFHGFIGGNRLIDRGRVGSHHFAHPYAARVAPSDYDPAKQIALAEDA